MRIARRLIFAVLAMTIWATVPAKAQQIYAPDSISRSMADIMPIYDSLLGESVDEQLTVLPRVDHNATPKSYIVGKINVHGAIAVDPQMIIDNLSIASGDTITIPGDDINIATRSLLDRRFFSNMKVLTSYRADTVDLDLYLRERIQVRGWNFIGIKGSERKDLEEKLRLRQYSELSDYLLSTCMDLIRKYYDEVVLEEQAYIMDPDKKVKQVVAEAAKELGADIKIKDFVCFKLGDGIEKKEEDFAAEVAAQLNK